MSNFEWDHDLMEMKPTNQPKNHYVHHWCSINHSLQINNLSLKIFQTWSLFLFNHCPKRHSFYNVIKIAQTTEKYQQFLYTAERFKCSNGARFNTNLMI